MDAVALQDVDKTMIDWREPFELSNGSKMSRVYPTDKTGSDFNLRIGPEGKGVPVSIFTGKNFDTGETYPRTRSVIVPLTGGDGEAGRNLDNIVLAAAKEHRGTWFPMQPDIKDEQIARAYVPLVRERDNYGPELRFNIDFDKKDSDDQAECAMFKKNAKGDIEAYEVPGTQSDGTPTREMAAMVFSTYVWIKPKPNGKKLDKFGFKTVVRGFLKCGSIISSSDEGISPDLQTIDTMRCDVKVSDFREGDNGFHFASVSVDGQDSFNMPENINRAKLWPAFGETSGRAQSADIEISGPVEENLASIETQVLESIRARHKEIGAESPDLVDDCYNQMVKHNGAYPSSIKFKLDKTVLVGSDLKPCDPDTLSSTLAIDERSRPKRLVAVAKQIRMYVYAKSGRDGGLESVGLKIQPEALMITDEGARGAAAMFAADASPKRAGEVGEENDVKKVKLSA